MTAGELPAAGRQPTTPEQRDALYGNGIEIGRIQKNALEWYRVAIRVFNGCELIDLRFYALNRRGELRPTRAGVAIRPADLADIIELLRGAKARADALGWIAEGTEGQGGTG